MFTRNLRLIRMNPFREPIAKLGKKITDRIPQKLGLKKITRNDPEYWGLAGVLSDEEAELALKLGVRKPKTLPEIVKLSGMEEKKCEALLEEMSLQGPSRIQLGKRCT